MHFDETPLDRYLITRQALTEVQQAFDKCEADYVEHLLNEAGLGMGKLAAPADQSYVIRVDEATVDGANGLLSVRGRLRKKDGKLSKVTRFIYADAGIVPYIVGTQSRERVQPQNLPTTSSQTRAASPENTSYISLMDRTTRQCAWVIGEPIGTATLMCGKPVVKGSSYCENHEGLSRRDIR